MSKLLHYKYNNVTYGSTSNNFNFLVAHYQNNVKRKIALIHSSDITAEILTQLIGKKVAGILIILTQIGITEEFKQLIEEFNNHRYNFPIYFAYETSELLSLYEDMKSLSPKLLSEYDAVQIGLSIDDENEKQSLILTNYISTVLKDDSETLPIIAVVSHYDSFGIAPEFSYSVNHAGSGFITVLEMSRRVKKMLEDMKSITNHEIMFILTSGSYPNFDGTNELFRKLDEQVIKRIKYVLCIESIGNSNSLYLHTNPKLESPEQKSLLHTLNEVAKMAGISIEVVNEINPTEANQWEYEVFAKKEIYSATLTQYQTSKREQSNSLSFSDKTVNKTMLNHHIDALSDYLVRIVCSFNQTTNEQISLYSKSDENYVTVLEDFLQNHSRFIYFLEKDSKPLNEIDKVCDY